MDCISPPPCPPTVTVRRNPPRRARATPASVVPIREPLCSSPSFARDIFSTELSQMNGSSDISTGADPSPKVLSESLKIYLRIRPPQVQKTCPNMVESKNAWPKNPKSKANNSKPKTKAREELCIQVSDDLCSVTVSKSQEMRRIKSEVYEGFSRVFASEASQCDVYTEMVRPLVEDFIKGKSGMLAAMGPTGSGKTHTVFGSVRDPGMVPLALRHIFSEKENMPRVFSLSMFEISSEGGKERMIDLLREGGDIAMHNSIIKGLQEAVVCDAQQAESLIAHGMFKRATASTNSNSQSSRSHCIINLRCNFDDDDGVGGEGRQATLTIVDLAGAEREKKTGNKGARLHESNFINNTSMVFSLCMRALLEHQKNRNKPLQKHYKSSLLTRYMKDYMEGKKRMMLILTVKPGVDDYQDTSFLLRQASPFTKVKFQTVEGITHLTRKKRPNQALPQAEQLKKIKLHCEVSSIDEGNVDADSQINVQKDSLQEVVKDNGLNQTIRNVYLENLNDSPAPSNAFVGLGCQKNLPANENHISAVDDYWEYRVLLGFSKALLAVLRQNKKEREGVEIENSQLRDQNLILEKELNKEKMRVRDLKSELKELKSRMHDREVSSDILPVAMHSSTTDDVEVLQCLEDIGRVCTPSGSQEHFQLTCATPYKSKQDAVNIVEDSKNMEHTGDFVTNDAPGVKEFKHACMEVVHSKCQELPTSIDDAEVLRSFEGSNDVHTSSGSLEAIELTSACLHSVNIVEDSKNMEHTCDFVTNDAPGVKELKHACMEVVHSKCQELPTSIVDAEVLHSFEGSNDVHTSSGSLEAIELTSACLHSRHGLGQDVVNIMVDPRSLDAEPGSNATNMPFNNIPLECGSGHSSEDAGIPKEAKTEPPQPKDSATDGASIIFDDPHISVDSRTIISESFGEDNMSSHVDETKHNDEEHKECSESPAASVKPRQGRAAKNTERCGNEHTEKPKRRLLPASSVLLKDFSVLDINDENEKPKGDKRDGKKAVIDDNKRTQGSLSLLNLLKTRLS